MLSETSPHVTVVAKGDQCPPALGMQRPNPVSRVHPCVPGALEQSERRWLSLYTLHFLSSLQATVTKRL